jgi:hypothetical protein
MAIGAGVPGRCPHCGAANPFGVVTCRYCNGALPPTGPVYPPPPPPSRDNFRLVNDEDTGAGSVIAFVVGGLLLLAGVGLLIGAAVAHQGAQSYDQSCAQMPNCSPAPDPSGAFTAGGIFLLIVALVVLVWGFMARSDRGAGADLTGP